VIVNPKFVRWAAPTDVNSGFVTLAAHPAAKKTWAKFNLNSALAGMICRL
jgi:hypothetical protein